MSFERVTPADIMQALEERAFILCYQPKISMISGDVCGAEALLRLKTKSGRLIYPDLFIPVAEESGLITQITKYVFSLLVRQLPAILANNSELVISFNASGKDFHDNKLTQFILHAIKEQQYNVKNIEIEVTETVVMDEVHSKALLIELADKGVPISMDDFGTGHSGLVELSRWPFSKIKIDKSFVNGIYSSSKNTEILQSTIRMAHQLNMEVVAEGIEDKETFTLLQKYGCKVGQGYWMSRPLSLDKFILYLGSYRVMPPFPIGVIYMAQLDHMQWKKTLIDAVLYVHRSHTLNGIKRVQGGLPELDHTCCKLGKWYYSVEAVFGHLDHYLILEQPHRELHQIGRDLLHAAVENCSIQELTDRITELSKKSVIIIDLLQSLENHWVIEQHESDS